MSGEQRRHFLGNISTQTERLQGLIDRLLELAALEHRNQLEDAETVPVGALLFETVLDLRPLCDGKKITIRTTADDPLTISGDRFLLSKAVTNILKNAIEFSPEHATIFITASRQNGKVLLMVKDQGPGVPDYARGRLTDRFYALAKPDGQKGSGLGLSFVKEIADLHGATLDIQNNEDSGLAVSLTFPEA